MREFKPCLGSSCSHKTRTEGHTRNLINPKFRLDIFRAFQIFALKSGAQKSPFL